MIKSQYILIKKGVLILNDIYNSLVTTIDKTKIKENEDMSKYTSFKAGGKARFLIKANQIQDIKDAIKITKEQNIPFLVIGNGSNILFKDGLYTGIIIKVELNKLEINKDKATVSAGVKNAVLAQKLLENELSGFEFAAGIPGTIGGAIRMNAGAYGGEIKDILEEVTYLDYSTLEEKTITNKECDFEYRHSVFCNNKNIILSATFNFNKDEKINIQEKMNLYAKSRKDNQPLEYPSAGSTFKRGEDFITAKLIDECGLKGYTIGGAQVSEKHAGFIINKDKATSKDIIELIDYVKKVVKEKKGKKIELEIEII